ncbi:RNA-binding protein [Trypanosoma rangeli]|uniref:RNA-binding protein n=1 Tax=Trypanosoma rangeli TaxID=5698 RepID=A0A422N4H9_TRYRA|nr:RNA-binding protein [Trypanosoma rangeli]RNF00341.1 RNA-binding protein [Trypanosoma rangeli]|eukprot:RNF00341.1 RNA-binding protein [Trypanosoma rangeli]
MPSRAVLRKKNRRESKRRRLEVEGAAVAFSLPRSEVLQAHAPQQVEDTGVMEKRAAAVNRKRPRETAVVVAPAEAVESTEGMTRKERKRFESKQRFERQLARVNAAVAKEEGTTSTTAAATAQVVGAEANSLSPTQGEKLRHDPKFKNGTFWRTRKERRGRTVFLGNMPARFTAQDVTDFVSSILDAYYVRSEEGVNGTKTEGDEGSGGVDLVDSVDFLPTKPRAKHRHMFVTLQSKEVADRVVRLLDAYTLEGAAVRCNFASDKTQRGEAIRCRTAASLHS